MPAQKKLSVEVARKRLQASGLRATTARIAILKLLYGRVSPVSHAEVTDALTDQGIDNSTIFRALNDMVESGLLHRMELGDHLWRYESADGKRADEQSPHPHFLCVDCGTITCLGEVDVRWLQKAGEPVRHVGDVTEVLLKGHCSACRDG